MEELSQPLRLFIEDFKSWSKEDQQKIKVSGLSFSISGLPNIITAKYDGSVGYYLDRYTAGREPLRRNLCTLIVSIQATD